MKSIRLFWVGVLFFVGSANAQEASSGYSQSYSIMIKGALAGSETVKESTNESGNLISTSDHEIYVTDGLGTKRMAFYTKMILAKSTWTPISYTYRYKTGDTTDSYEVAIKDGKITRTLTRNGRTSEISVAAPPNMVILDFNVYHQYDYLIRKYDVKKGERQLFTDFMPIIGNDIPVAVTFLGDANLNSEKGSIAARNFRIEFVGIWTGSLFVDAEGRLLRLIIPAQDLEVVRNDLLASNDSNKERE